MPNKPGAGVLLAPMSYQPGTDDDLFELFRTVTEHTELPVIVYDNPGTTHFTFSIGLYARIARLPGIASIKIPGVPSDPAAARAHVSAVRAAVPEHVTIGVSGDAFAATGLTVKVSRPSALTAPAREAIRRASPPRAAARTRRR